METGTNNVWQQRSDTYHPGNTAMDTKILPSGIYRYVETMTGWYIEKIASRYNFPYKLYGTHDPIITRIQRAWEGLEGNFGVLLNGIKGTGKTITAQVVANWAVDQGYPVLTVPSPIPLSEILERIEQPMVVIFDEFEKSHKKPEDQQKLLSAIDGMSRNINKRLFVFTTNVMEIDDNFIDRPSRIRYCWEFRRLNDSIIEMILDDMLDKRLKELRSSIVTYLNTRKILTIDIVKTTITECNLFKETPDEFESIMNLSAQEPRGYILSIIEKGEVIGEIAQFFKPTRKNELQRLQKLLTKSGREEAIFSTFDMQRTITFDSNGQLIKIVDSTEKTNEWICHAQIPPFKSWIGKRLLREIYEEGLWIDEQPIDWTIPKWAKKLETGKELSEDEETEKYDWINSGHVFGTNTSKKLRIRFEINDKPLYISVR